MKAKHSEKYVYSVPVRLTRDVMVTVIARDADEAMDKVRRGEWTDEAIFETVDWQPTGEPTI